MWDDMQSKIINYLVTHTLDGLAKSSEQYGSYVLSVKEAKEDTTPIPAD